MSEWVSVLAVFWVLWALDGARRAPRRIFSVTGRGGRRPWATLRYGRISCPGVSPLHWRMALTDVPFSISPLGIVNTPSGSAGRPAETPSRVLAFAWAEMHDVGVAQGWIYLNGARFCPDSGHFAAPQLLELARLPAEAREKKIRATMNRWFRPAHLRRRVAVLAGRTQLPATLNLVTFAGFALTTIYVVGDVASRLPARMSDLLARAAPAWLLALLLLHVASVVFAWRALRRLKPVAAEARRANLLSALLLPPQGLRLRALLGEGFFPAQHPVAVAVGFRRPGDDAPWAFHALADLHWPIDAGAQPPLAKAVVAWFRTALEAKVRSVLQLAAVDADSLLAAPEPDAAGSCHYCPRCRDQFVAGPRTCAHGITLLPVRQKAGRSGS